LSVLDKVAIRIADFKLVLADAGDSSKIGDVGVQVNDGFDSVFSPVVNHPVPLRILLLIQLPVPQQPLPLRILMLPNPILHPDPNHRQSQTLHIRVLLINKILSVDHAHNTPLLNPGGEWLHSTDGS